MSDEFFQTVARGIPDELPEMPPEAPGINHAPPRRQVLNPAERRLALANALRYFPAKHHQTLAPEFARELRDDGRIYMRRFRPHYPMHARPIDQYPAKCTEAAAIMLMITNNLDPVVAQHPYELVTYGGNGTVFQNWAQYLLTMKYLSELEADQTLVLYSGHPLGVFPSTRGGPRLVLTCGMVVPNYSKPEDYERLAALGVTSYGQMTAGSFMYIGSQGIVHGTTITLLNAARRYLGTESHDDIRGKIFVTSGLGGMSGAQPKAAVIAGAIGVTAEVNPKAVKTRHDQGWVQEVEADLDELLRRVDRARKDREPLSIAYQGNVVDLWERMVEAGFDVELGSDQTSLHNPHAGGYYPAGLDLEESNRMMVDDPEGFRERVSESLKRQVTAINAMADRGMHFWDYGNAFLLEAGRAGADVFESDGTFRYPSYVEDIMGPACFDYGFGPFRWVCTSGTAEDLRESDRLAADIMEGMAQEAPPETRQQLLDNVRWVREAERHQLVVGSQARILYSDEQGRIRIATAFNEAIRAGRISAPIVLGRDHHDVSGTDSPYRETANIYDGSRQCADMAVHNVIGDAFRGASWVSLHNGGGVGWGEVMNGGFGLVLDGTDEAASRLESMLFWDVNNGIARRAWARNEGAEFAAERVMEREPKLRITMPQHAADALLDEALGQSYD
ncbi:MAG: urocanate hydratase [Deltaproteobacteria bacterium]|jgi:urocanate hydratase|nr:urocanate hydratase [Deltaproteobacteria bacterium]MBW2535012.1 urocanate hydratase [Deltaproteobacteria bacterium]